MRCWSQWYLFFLLLGDVFSDISFTLTLNAQLLHIADIPGARMIKVKTLHLQELLSPKDCLLMFWGAWWYLKKWNFYFLFFPWKGGGSCMPLTYFKNVFFVKTIIIPWLSKWVLHKVWALYHIHIVVHGYGWIY